MAAREQNGDRAEDQPRVFQPPDEYTAHQPAASATPYKVKPNSMGVELAVAPEVHQVYTNRRGDKVRFCERGNTFGLMVIGDVMQLMHVEKDRFAAAAAAAEDRSIGSEDDEEEDDERILNRVGEVEHFATVIKAQAKQLGDMVGIVSEEPNQRQTASLQKLWYGFNKDPANFTRNPELDKVALTYIKLRLGVIPFYGDELQAAMEAVKHYYCDTTSELIKTPKKRKAVLNHPEKGSWTLPGVYALNDHLKGCHLAPIEFSLDATEFLRARQNRAAHNRVIWVGESRIKAKVESRQQVIDDFVAHAANALDVQLDSVVDDEGAPEDEEEDERPPQRLRYHMGYD